MDDGCTEELCGIPPAIRLSSAQVISSSHLPLPPSPIRWAPPPLGSAKSFADAERDC